MSRITSRWTARIAALILIMLLALGAWAQKQGRFDPGATHRVEITPGPALAGGN